MMETLKLESGLTYRTQIAKHPPATAATQLAKEEAMTWKR
jgi:hypothetical protein